MRFKLFSHSRLDGLLVLLALAQFGVLLYGVLTFGSVHWGVSLLVGLLSVFLMCTNFQCVAHNFIHNPFFTSRRLNSFFALFNSLLIGGAQSLYRVHHLHHHKYNNDAPNPQTGNTQDVTSTWRHSRWPGQEEGFLTYALFGYFRSDFGFLLREAKRRQVLGKVAVESLVFLSMVVAFAILNPLGLLAFYLPVWLLGNMAAQAENYLEHYGAIPGNRMTDSVSSYGKLYNLIWFNNGYHQEHHYRPQVHWSHLPEVKPLLPGESERRVVTGAHWFNFGAGKPDRISPLPRPLVQTPPLNQERQHPEAEAALAGKAA
jgi:fatty acid desaturase